ncbi:MAG: hypothetical protein WA162_01485 [Thermodesulfobacteriota bacterium]
MPAPSKNWTNVADSQIDADSPLDTTLVTSIRDNDIHVKEWLGYGYTANQAHDHDGVNSKLVVLASQTAGDYLLDSNPDMRSLALTASYVKIKETKVGVGGVFRIKFDACALLGIQARIHRNGVAVGTERSVMAGVTSVLFSSYTLYNYGPSYLENYFYHWTDGTNEFATYGNYVVYSEDIGGWSPGDLVQIYVKRTGGGGTAYVRNLNIFTAAPPIAGGLLNY